MQIFFAV